LRLAPPRERDLLIFMVTVHFASYHPVTLTTQTNSFGCISPFGCISRRADNNCVLQHFADKDGTANGVQDDLAIVDIGGEGVKDSNGMDVPSLGGAFTRKSRLRGCQTVKVGVGMCPKFVCAKNVRKFNYVQYLYCTSTGIWLLL
jgi:hypothetical protein